MIFWLAWSHRQRSQDVTSRSDGCARRARLAGLGLAAAGAIMGAIPARAQDTTSRPGPDPVPAWPGKGVERAGAGRRPARDCTRAA